MRLNLRLGVLIGLSILTASSATHAQQSGKLPRVGVIATLTSVPVYRNIVFQPFLAGLRDLGYEEGRNVAFEFRSAEGHLDRLPDILTELVALKVDVLVAPVCGAPLNAAMEATKTIPIVVAACNDDMIETGIIASLAHPGGNVTGLNKMTPELTAKRLDLIEEMVPSARNVGVLWDPLYSAFVGDWAELRARAKMKNVMLHPVDAHLPSDLEKAFSVIVRERVDAVLTFSDVMTYNFPGRWLSLHLQTGYQSLRQSGK